MRFLLGLGCTSTSTASTTHPDILKTPRFSDLSAFWPLPKALLTLLRASCLSALGQGSALGNPYQNIEPPLPPPPPSNAHTPLTSPPMPTPDDMSQSPCMQQNAACHKGIAGLPTSEQNIGFSCVQCLSSGPGYAYCRRKVFELPCAQ